MPGTIVSGLDVVAVLVVLVVFFQCFFFEFSSFDATTSTKKYRISMLQIRENAALAEAAAVFCNLDRVKF